MPGPRVAGLGEANRVVGRVLGGVGYTLGVASANEAPRPKVGLL